MITKDQERKTLERIRKIVAGLGEISYIGTAFEGCFEIAEENIANDFACSMKQRAEAAERDAKKVSDALRAANKTIEDLEATNDILGERIMQHDKNYEELRQKKEEYKQNALEHWNKYREAQNRLIVAEAEIVKLKAKLYDLLVKEG